MKDPILVKRYAEGLAGALPDAAEFEAVHRELAEFGGFLAGTTRLGELLRRSFLTTARKAALVGEIVEEAGYRAKTRRFLLLLVQHRRLGVLDPVIRVLPAVWRDRRGIRTFEVRSVVALTEAQKSRLEAELARLEDAPVACTYGLDPGLIGGILLRKGNLIYDTSLKGQLGRIQDIISER
jgi:F-type H+-transporting ATPase subunit delta